MRIKKIEKVLLFYKKSTYQHSFLDRRKFPATGTKIITRFKVTHARHYNALAQIESALTNAGIKYTLRTRGIHLTTGWQEDLAEYGLVITAGGDGTFLEAARDLKKHLILGINSDPEWSVGRFCTATSRTFPSVLNAVLNNRFKTALLNRLRLKIRGRKSINVLNDILICHKNPAAMSRYDIIIGGTREEQRSSGVWVATASGSTGAIQSAGGRSLPPTSKKFQYYVRELYYGRGTRHRLTGGVLDSRESIKFISRMKDGIIYADGAHVSFPFSLGDQAVISRSPQPLRVIKG